MRQFRTLWLSLGLGLMISAVGVSAYAGAVCESCQLGGQNYGQPCCKGR